MDGSENVGKENSKLCTSLVNPGGELRERHEVGKFVIIGARLFRSILQGWETIRGPRTESEGGEQLWERRLVPPGLSPTGSVAGVPAIF